MLARVLICVAQISVLPNGQLTPNHQAQGPKHSITGTVSNAVTGEPIRRALVRLMGQTQASTLTGPDGRFRFEEVPEGSVMFNAQKPGFFDSQSVGLAEWNMTRPNSYAVGSGANDFAIKLYPGASITGRITNSDGEPIEGSHVQVFAEQIQEGRKQYQPRNGVTTDEDGGFRIEELTPGRYLIFCSGHAIPPMSWNGVREVYPPVYYPDAKEKTSAQTLELQAGQDLMVDFRLRKEHGYRVSAQVTSMGAAMGGAPMIENESGQIINFGRMHFDRAKGEFSIEGVPSGTWVLEMRGGDREGHMYEARQEFTMDHADLGGLQLQTQVDAMIPVTVNQLENRQSAATTAMVVGGGSFQNQNVNMQAQLISVEPARQQRSYIAGLQGDPPTMRFMNVPAGRYRLAVRSFGDQCLDSATYGGIDLMRDELVVSPDSGAQPVTINLTSQCAVLKIGLKGEGKNFAFAIVISSGTSAEPSVQPIMPQEQQQMRLPAGTYRVLAFSNLSGLEYANPEAMRNYASQTITVGAGETQQVTVDVIDRKGN